MDIRPYRSEDAPALSAIFFAAVRELARKDYSPEQVGAWARRAPEPSGYETRAGDGRVLLVAVDEADIPIAYADLERDGHIDHLYCRPDHAGIGVASALIDRLIVIARERRMRDLYVEASETAKPLFESKGFAVVERRAFILTGVGIHNYLMTKTL